MMANIGRSCAKEVAQGCTPDQNRPPILILASAIAVDPTITDDFGLEVEHRSMPRKYTANGTPPGRKRQRSDSGDITGFENRQCSNGDLHATDSQVNSKYVQIDIGTLTDGLSPNIHRSTAVASHGLIRLLLASFCRFADRSRDPSVRPKLDFARLIHLVALAQAADDCRLRSIVPTYLGSCLNNQEVAWFPTRLIWSLTHSLIRDPRGYRPSPRLRHSLTHSHHHATTDTTQTHHVKKKSHIESSRVKGLAIVLSKPGTGGLETAGVDGDGLLGDDVKWQWTGTAWS
ncbi:hypothetical protein THAOC_02333 [Thalassiosira oceanica]|uniref:Uncharacterized protein n=1 Tax=Thalassiosira oceanica TaxID=159749 RepID=K0TFU1_THAOC|nr:hypothetical protein THAOC_02333 [Thalassiosira oceanica]|eukprot:EJK75929.1 hypothetical protein THAOC_02333 [Thalassiosira oceanica]